MVCRTPFHIVLLPFPRVPHNSRTCDARYLVFSGFAASTLRSHLSSVLLDPSVLWDSTSTNPTNPNRFLLKYVSRDELELLGRGNGGIVEVRNAIAQHEDNSPLYGFLRYRRRNVMIKYLPEDCSRLVQGLLTYPTPFIGSPFLAWVKMGRERMRQQVDNVL